MQNQTQITSTQIESCNSCWRTPRPGYKTCRVHLAQAKKYRRERLSKGLCEYFGCSNPHESGHTQCQKHLDNMLAASLARRAERIKAGSCIDCGIRPPFWGQRCIICRQNYTKDPLPPGLKKALKKHRRLQVINARRAQAATALDKVRDERARTILTMRHGLEDGIDRTLEEIAPRFGVTRERIRQIEAKLYRTLARESVAVDLLKNPTELQRSPNRPERKLSKSERRKEVARNAVKNAVRKGTLARKPCERCGSPKVSAHHHDYSKPLDVIWLCGTHHAEAHGKEVRTKPPTPEYYVPCWLANIEPSGELYDAPAIVSTLSTLWIKQQQVMDVTGLKRATVLKIVKGEPVDDKDLARMLRYVEITKQQKAA